MSQKMVMATKVIYSFEARRKLQRLLKEFFPSIAHLHCIYHHLSPAILPVLSQAGIPTVMTAHDLKIACPAYKMLNNGGICERCRDGSVLNVVRHRCIRGSFAASVVVAVESGLQRKLRMYERHLSKIVVPSRFFLEKFVEWGWSRDKFSYIPNYVDVARFTALYDPGDYFVYFGRLAPEKGVGTLLRAAKEAAVRVKIVGTGPEEEALRALDARLGGAAEFLGYRRGAELQEIVGHARAVVTPSEWYENAPMSVLESFALGKPVIGSRIGGIPEMIEVGLNGWLYESGDVAGLAEIMRRVRDCGAQKLVEIGKEARSFVEKRFSRVLYAEAILNLYSDLGVKC